MKQPEPPTRNSLDLRRHARLRSDAPNVRGIEPGRWYDIYSGDPTSAANAASDASILVRPADALPGDRASYIPLAITMVELRDAYGRRLIGDSAGEWWTAARIAPDRILFVARSGAYRMVAALPQDGPDEPSDSVITGLLENGAPSYPQGLRVEAQLKAAQAWSYRMLNAEAWYLVDQERTSESAVAIVTMDGPRIVDAAHLEVRSFLD